METQFVNKKRMIRPLLLIPALIIVSIFGGPSGRAAMDSNTCTNPVFAPVLTSLRAGTSVPLRLPFVVGEAYDAALYAEVVEVSRTRYVVRIGQHCERSYCPYGIVSGMKISRRTPRPSGRIVELNGGISARIIDGSKTLKNSTIAWQQGQYRYEVSIYAAEPDGLIKVANSALSCDAQ
jgi:hypothetical protein